MAAWWVSLVCAFILVPCDAQTGELCFRDVCGVCVVLYLQTSRSTLIRTVHAKGVGLLATNTVAHDQTLVRTVQAKGVGLLATNTVAHDSIQSLCVGYTATSQLMITL